MTLEKRYYAKSNQDLGTHVYNINIFNTEDEIIYKSQVGHISELRSHIAAIKKHLLTNNLTILRREVNSLRQRRKECPSIDGKTLKEAIEIQEYTSTIPLQNIMSERKAIHGLSR